MSLQVKTAKYGMRSAYMGDPGIFGSIGKALGGIAKTAVGAVGGLLTTGTPMGAIGGALKGAGIIKTTPPTITPATSVVPYTGGMMQGRAVMPGIGSTGPLTTGAVAAAINGAGINGRRAFPATRAEGPPGPGYHLNKGGYYRRSPAGSIVYIPPEAVWVRNRRRNPLNPRALDRAMGRVTSAKAASKKLARISIRKSCSCK